RIFDGVDEAGGALRARVAGDAEFYLLRGRVPMPVGSVGVGLDAITAYVEPDGRVEGRVLADEEMDQLVVESDGVFKGAEIAVLQAPVTDGLGHAADQLTDAGFALAGIHAAVEIFAGDDIGRGHRPVFGNFHIFLLEDGVALGVGNGGGAEFPFDVVVGRDAGL